MLPAGAWGKHKLIWQTIAIVTIIVGMSLQTDLMPRVLHGWSGGAAFQIAFVPFFHIVANVMVWIVAVLTVISGGVYMWQCRDLYCDQL